mmetsp:Transcript_17499/g.24599  ORF Transcript_17499/g.24599 Transcript_17499/m.24599 type:complete len:518 (+) Transcript_17499:437-1990(+)
MSSENKKDNRWVDANLPEALLIDGVTHEKKELKNRSTRDVSSSSNKERQPQVTSQQHQQQLPPFHWFGPAFTTGTSPRTALIGPFRTPPITNTNIWTTPITTTDNIHAPSVVHGDETIKQQEQEQQNRHNPSGTTMNQHGDIWSNPPTDSTSLGTPFDTTFGLHHLSEAESTASRISILTRDTATTSTDSPEAAVTAAPSPFFTTTIVQKISVPAKVQLSEWYAKPPRYKIVNKSNYLTWQDGEMPHIAKFTSIFLCPLTGEAWCSGRHGDNSQDPDFYQIRHDTRANVDVVWYKKKMWAEHAAAARALDCILLRENATNSHTNLHKSEKLPPGLVLEAPYMSLEVAPKLPSSIPPHLHHRIKQFQGGVQNPNQHTQQSQSPAIGQSHAQQQKRTQHQSSADQVQAQQNNVITPGPSATVATTPFHHPDSAISVKEQGQLYNDDYKAARQNSGGNSEQNQEDKTSSYQPQGPQLGSGGGSTHNNFSPPGFSGRQYNHEYNLFHAPDSQVSNFENNRD